MANDQGTSAGAVMMAFMAGAAVGAAVALLWAPASGEETRDYLGQRAREGRDRAAEAAREGRERAAEAAREGRELLNRQRDSVTSAFERVRDRAAAPEGQDS
jgi:gas vesicle protein